MREDALARVMAQLAVHQGGESVSQMLLGLGQMPPGRIRP
jgi:hypothetical protein